MRKATITVLVFGFLSLAPSANAQTQPTAKCEIQGQKAAVLTNSGSIGYRCEFNIAVTYNDGTTGNHVDSSSIATGGTNRPSLVVNLPKPASSCSVTQNCKPN